MTPDQGALIITLVVTLGTVVNAWISIRIRGDISQMKVWVFQEFVSKDECNRTHRADR